MAERAAIVSRRRSVLIDVATTGPFHSRIAGIAKPVVLPVCVGPTTITDCLGSAATRCPAARPRIRRPGRFLRTRSERRSSGRAHRAVPLTTCRSRSRPNDQQRARRRRDEERGEGRRRSARARDQRSRECGPRARRGLRCGAEARRGRDPISETRTCGHDSAEQSPGELPGSPDERAERDERAEDPERDRFERMRLGSVAAPRIAARTSRSSCRRPHGHARVRVDDLALECREPVLDEERTLSDLPERPAAAEVRQQLRFRVG